MRNEKPIKSRFHALIMAYAVSIRSGSSLPIAVELKYHFIQHLQDAGVCAISPLSEDDEWIVYQRDTSGELTLRSIIDQFVADYDRFVVGLCVGWFPCVYDVIGVTYDVGDRSGIIVAV